MIDGLVAERAFQSLFLPIPPTQGIYLSFGDDTAPDRFQIAAIASGAAPYHLQMGTLATSARTGTTAEAPGPILGLVAGVYPAQELVDVAIKMAKKISGKGRMSVLMAKEAVNASQELTIR
jgi:hypothetical protein